MGDRGEKTIEIARLGLGRHDIVPVRIKT